MRHVFRAVAIGVYSVLVIGSLSCSSGSARTSQIAADARPLAVRNEAAAPYRIQPDDVLKVEFTYHPEFNRSVVVRSDSMITLPLLGDFRAGGMRPEQLARDASAGYSGLLRYPEITVELVESPSQIVYVGGEVKTPGIYPVSPGKTLLQCIVQAGGTTAEASRQRAFLVRDQGTSEPLYITLNLKGAERNFALQPKDILVVPKSNIATANQFVDQYINKLIPFSKSLGVTYFIGNGIN